MLLVPTRVANKSRWQLFAQNSRSGGIDAFSIERSADGLFDTRGELFLTCPDHPDVFALEPGACPQPARRDRHETCGREPIPVVDRSGYAGAALRFAAPGDHVEFLPPAPLGPAFTIELWLRLDDGLTGRRTILGADTQAAADTPPTLSLVAGRQLRVGWGDGKEFRATTTGDVLIDDAWHHVAVTYDRALVRVYIDGVLRHRADELDGHLPPTASAPRYLGAPQDGFIGTVDELRLWGVARSAGDVHMAMSRRLSGLEPGVLRYWRLDEGRGDAVRDLVGGEAHGAVDGQAWTAPDAPVGESVGISRATFPLAGRQVSTGMSALLYHQQEKGPSGYGGAAKPLKQGARVMLAVGTSHPPSSGRPAAPPEMVVLDLGVGADGRLAELDGELELKRRTAPRYLSGDDADDTDEQLATAAAARALLAAADAVAASPEPLDALEQALAGGAGQPGGAVPDKAAELIAAAGEAWAARVRAQVARDALAAQEQNATVVTYQHRSMLGVEQRWGLGPATGLRPNDVSSLTVSAGVEAILWDAPAQTGEFLSLSVGLGWIGDAWNDRVQSMTVRMTDDWQRDMAAAEDRLATADVPYQRAWPPMLGALEAAEKQLGDIAAVPRVGDLMVELQQREATATSLRRQIADARARVAELTAPLATLEYLLTAPVSAPPPADVPEGIAGIVQAAVNTPGLAGVSQATLEALDRSRAAAQVVTYEFYGFAGRSQTWGLGEATVDEGLWNDRISSLQISPGVVAKCYEHAGRGGWSITFAGDQWGVPDWANDSISHIDIAMSPEWMLRRSALAIAVQVQSFALQASLQAVTAKAAELRTEIERASRVLEQVPVLAATEVRIAELRAALTGDFGVRMPLVAVDRRGLTVTGAVCAFAQSTNRPQLFDSALGRISLYFRGVDDDFLVAHYSTLTDRAVFAVPAGRGSVVLTARSPDLSDGLDLEIEEDPEDADGRCTVTIRLDDAARPVTETWRRVPRDAARLADVLNGRAAEAAFVGRVAPGRHEAELRLEAGARVRVDPGARLTVAGVTRTARDGAEPGAGVIALEDGPPVDAPADTTDPRAGAVSAVAYDYAAHAATTQRPADLSGGSQLLVAAAGDAWARWRQGRIRRRAPAPRAAGWPRLRAARSTSTDTPGSRAPAPARNPRSRLPGT